MDNYNLELSKVVTRIKAEKAKLVCIQLPDGLKPEAGKIADEIKAKTKAQVLIWLGSNFGACDIPIGLQQLKVDILLSWGHNKFLRREGW